MNATRLHRTKDGRMVCVPHHTSGRPMFLTPGCWRCDEAIAKGDKRKLSTDFTKKERARAGVRYGQSGFIDWEKLKREKKARDDRKAFEAAIVPGRTA